MSDAEAEAEAYKRLVASLVVRIENAALRYGEGESTTESQLRRALSWAEAQRPRADPGAEQEALEKAVSRLAAKLQQLIAPQG
jgi:hypothetical protein